MNQCNGQMLFLNMIFDSQNNFSCMYFKVQTCKFAVDFKQSTTYHFKWTFYGHNWNLANYYSDSSNRVQIYTLWVKIQRSLQFLYHDLTIPLWKGFPNGPWLWQGTWLQRTVWYWLCFVIKEERRRATLYRLVSPYIFIVKGVTSMIMSTVGT